jgi:hypothetical protein
LVACTADHEAARRSMPGLPSDFCDRLREALYLLFAERPRITETTERAVVGRLAIYLDRVFGDLVEPESPNPLVWDVEYMRARDIAKAFRPVRPQTDVTAVTPRLLAPDLLWHRRLLGEQVPNTIAADANLAVIEVKLRASRSALLSDRAKLRLLCGLEAVIRRYKVDLRCPDDEPPGSQEYLGDLALPPSIKPYALGASLNIFQRHAVIVEYRQGEQDVVEWSVR